jgi:glutaminase
VTAPHVFVMAAEPTSPDKLRREVASNRKIPTINDASKVAHAELVGNKAGHVPMYIPALAGVNADLWGVASCDMGGGITKAGDASTPFPLEGCGAAITYCVARTMRGDAVHQHVGYEAASGLFNEIALNGRNLPHNPFVNTGAIMVASLIEPEKEVDERFEAVMAFYRAAAGPGVLGFDQAVCESEASVGDRNTTLAYFMRDQGSYEGKQTDAQIRGHLCLYYKLCAVTADVASLAKIAATLANGGTNPSSGERVFGEEIVRDCLALMSSCGMFGLSGQFGCTVGLPAKSGVSGGMMVVVPGVGGLATFSPRLDQHGHSVRGVAFYRRFAELTEHTYHALGALRYQR